MKGQYVDRKGRIYGVTSENGRFCAAVFDRCYGYRRLAERDAPLRDTPEEAQADLDYYACEHEARPTEIQAVRFSVHEGATAEAVRLFDAASGTACSFAFAQLVEPGVVYVSNRVPGAVDVPGIGCAGDTFYLVGEGGETGDYRSLSARDQARWMKILQEVRMHGTDEERAG